jgi:DNA-binding transcriptional regulator WhiA
LKHAAITWLVKKGWSIEEIGEFIETSTETVRRVYLHGSSEKLTKQADDLGEMVGPSTQLVYSKLDGTDPKN